MRRSLNGNVNISSRHGQSTSMGMYGKHFKLPKGVKIDPEDIPLVASYNNWNITDTGKVVSVYMKTINGKKTYKTYSLHRVIMNVEDSKQEVDHINHDKLDNRKSNLRVCSHAENGRNLPLKRNNTSGFRGVHWDKSREKWLVSIKLNFKGIFIGRYKTFEEAVSARLFAENIYFGDYAPKLTIGEMI